MDELASWRAGAAKDAIARFLTAARAVPVERRVAVFDHDGTLCCEKPNLLVTEFFLGELRAAVAARPELASRADYSLLLHGGPMEEQGFGLRRAAYAVYGLSGGITPEEFSARVRRFASTYVHPELHIRSRQLIYQPLLELMTALREQDFALFISAPLGTEVVRAISSAHYGVPPERVVGALLDYETRPAPDGGLDLVRPADLRFIVGASPDVVSLVAQTGRHPMISAANTIEDRDLLNYTLGADGPALALYIVHDDAEREYAYGQSPIPPQPGWTVVSMRHDWKSIFPPR